MKVLILANSDGGLYNFRRELLQVLTKTHEVYICLPNGSLIGELEAMGCKFIPSEFDRHGTNPIKELQLLHLYIKTIKKVRPDIVLTYTIKPNIYGSMACGLLKVPYVANITGLGTAVENPGLMQKITLMLYKMGIGKAQKVFFQNSENQSFMVSNGVVKGNHDLLPGSGVNLQRYTAQPYPEGDVVNFVFVARVMKEKGIDQYLEAAKFIKEKYPYTRFHVCGSMEQDYQAILDEAQKAGTIVYHGVVKDMAAIYSQMSCTVHPTYYPEGMSNVLLESAASARPVITTDRAGCREVVDNGVNGFVVEQKNAKDLIEKIEQFLALSWEERRAMGLAGRAKVEKEFDRQIVVDKYMKELEVRQPEKVV